MDRNELLRWWAKTFFFPNSAPHTDAAIIALVMDEGDERAFWALEANFSRAELITALETAPTLRFRPRSWVYWHFRLGLISMAAELPNPPRWDIDATAPEDVALQAIPPEQAQAAIEWLGQLNQVTAPPASPVDDDQYRGDPVHELAFALKEAGVVSTNAMDSLLARYVKYRFFRESQLIPKLPALHDLLAQCDPTMPLDAADQAWLNSPPVGLEVIDAPRPPEALAEFIRQLQAQALPEQALEIGDLGNAIGVVLGRGVADKQSLLQEFEAGFRRGVRSTRTEKPDWTSFFQSAQQWDEPK